MGALQAFMSRARGRIRQPFPSNSKLLRTDQPKTYLLSPIVRFEKLSHGTFTKIAERIWPGSSSCCPTVSHKGVPQDAEALLEDAKEFAQAIKQNIGIPDVGSKDDGIPAFDQTNFLTDQRILWLHQKISLVNSRDSDLFSKGPTFSKKGSVYSSLLKSSDVIRAPGFHESKDSIIQADSVKRKRKKKMNKHKHRKLRRLAHRSRK